MTQLIDRFSRQINYLRLSVTDRCDFRCVYCMSEKMQFLPRKEVLSLEELYEVTAAFSELGVKKVRITGGEPLVRHNVLELFQRIAQLPDIETLAITTNGSQLQTMAEPLYEAGVKQINISLDSLNEQRFGEITRTGKLQDVLSGIKKTTELGFEKVRINSVILQGENDDELESLVSFAEEHKVDIAFIEEMPLGEVGRSREDAFVSGLQLRERLQGAGFKLLPVDNGIIQGPARYWQLNQGPSKVGFIEPHSNNFCASCNRVRVTVQGRLLLCLGNEHSLDLRALLRSGCSREELKQQIIAAMSIKPEKHEFDLAQPVEIKRFMNETGG